MSDYDDLVWREDAIERVLALRSELLASQPTEAVTLPEISGRVLADDIVADSDAPSRSTATMDGFAFDATEGYPYELRAGESFPESSPEMLEPGTAVRVATGGPLPEGANAVLKREEATVEDGKLRGPQIEPGTYVYARGNNYRADERLFEAGERLGSKDAILLRDLGYETVAVRRPLSVGILATGTEIVENPERDKDSAMLHGLVRSWGHEADILAPVHDRYDQIVATIREAAGEYDVVITTGGTSVGHKDYVVRAVDDLGDVLFHLVRLRPGKPIAVAKLPDAVAVAIPGKPLGALTIAAFVARPLFVGADPISRLEVTMDRDVELGPDGFEYAIPVTIDGGTAMPLGHVDSELAVYERVFDPSVVSSSTRATRADGVILTTTALTAGETVGAVPFSTLD